jgi:disulfide bond formation protein DsbB
VLLAAAVVVVACASRRRLALALVLLTAVVGVDAAVHPVHHLNDPGAAAACLLASSFTHAPAVLTDGASVAAAPAPSPDAHADVAPARAAARFSRPDSGRAPPFSAA